MKRAPYVVTLWELPERFSPYMEAFPLYAVVRGEFARHENGKWFLEEWFLDEVLYLRSGTFYDAEMEPSEVELSKDEMLRVEQRLYDRLMTDGLST